MRMVGQVCLLAAFIGTGYAAFACILGAKLQRHIVRRGGLASGVGSMVALSIVVIVLAWALLVKDFSFLYVSRYSSRLLSWHYSLSALWVGQAGSLLLWTWLLGVLALLFRFWPTKQFSQLRDASFGVLMAYCCFLSATMVFAADPMEANIAPGDEGSGLSPLLQHPAMLIHPPIVFLGYAAWAIPCALAIAALLHPKIASDATDRESRKRSKSAHLRAISHDDELDSAVIDSTWARQARPWALFAWTVLGAGILLGAWWSYEELGWGGYWAWDPVENGSLIPWLIGTALIHGLMAWQFRGTFKKTSITLAFATFGMCNFATFLTRSGIFSSLHAFSQSPIGWLFLWFMLALAVGALVLMVRNREGLTAENRIGSIWSREAMVLLAIIALLLLATVAVAGTLSVALSEAIVGRRIIVGPPFYDSVLIPTGLVLLATLALAPLLRWGAPPTTSQKRTLLVSASAATVVAIVAVALGARHPIALAVAWLAGFAFAALIGALALDTLRRNRARPWHGLLKALATGHRQYAGFAIHVGFVCIAIGVTGSALGTQRHDLVLREGETAEWAGRSIRFTRLIERDLPDKFIAEAELEISHGGAAPYRLLPAQHWHRLQNQWTTEVAVHSTWTGDFYTILHSGEGPGAVRLTLVENPLMRWMWFGGLVIVIGAVVRLTPLQHFASRQRQTDDDHGHRDTRGKANQKVERVAA